MATLRDLVENVRSQRAERLKAHLEPLANGSAWTVAPWLRQGGRTLDAVYVEPDVVRWDRARPPETVNEELRAAVAPSVDDRTRRRWADVWGDVRRAVILGRPGEGKTTLLQRTCQRVAASSLALWKGRTTPLDAIPVPIWVRAEEIIRAGSVEAALGVAGSRAPEAVSMALSGDDRRAALQSPTTWLFIDALDERPSDVLPAHAVTALASLGAVCARIVLSVRSYAWQETALPFPVAKVLTKFRSFCVPLLGHVTISLVGGPSGADEAALAVYELAPLTRAQREEVVARWCATDVDRRDQLTALLDSAPMRELTSNALLLTLLCAAATADPSRKISRETRRAELYAWLVTDLVTRADKNPLLPGSRAAQDRLLALQLAAWALWQRHPGGPFPYRTWAEQLRSACEKLWLSADVYQAMQDEVERTGLLVNEGHARRFFPQTAYEYLAGAGLVQDVDLTPEAPAAIAKTLAAHAGDTAWRELSLLAIGDLAVVQQCPDLAGQVVAAALKARDGPPGETVALMGEALVEAGKAAAPRDVQDRTITRLFETMRSAVPPGKAGHVPAKTRARAGTALGWLGDPRFEGNPWKLPNDPLVGFVCIPRGRFLMGSTEDDPTADDDERPQHDVVLKYDYFITRWPVTVAQFTAFVMDTRHNRRFTPSDRRCLDGVPNHPVVWVSWDEALAYGRWLTARLRAWGRTPPALRAVLASGAVTLPSEAEWEKAARGTCGRVYPWGATLEPDFANYPDAAIRNDSAVGSFPRGATPKADGGVEDLAGNVWEWTRSEYKPYPYDPRDERENLAGHGTRVVRGGVFFLDPRGLRSACRYWFHPKNRDYNVGFRVVVSPFVDPLILNSVDSDL